MRQPSRCDDNVADIAGRCQRAFGHRIRAARDQQVPVPPLPVQHQRAIVGAAARTGPVGQRQSLAVHAGTLGEIVYRVAALGRVAGLAQHQQAVIGLADNPDMTAIARYQQVRRLKQQQRHGSNCCRKQAKQTHLAAPQRQPQRPGDEQQEPPLAHRRQMIDRARSGSGPVSDAEQQFQTFSRKPPNRSAQTSHIEEQRQCDQRHRDECRQRNGHDIGQCAVNPGPVKMIEGNRHQGQFDDHAGRKQHRCLTRAAHQPAFFAVCEKPAHRLAAMQGNDREHRGKAHLEARPGDSLGPKQHDQHRGNRQHAQRQRLAPQRHGQQDQQCPGARSNRRHFRAGQQGIANPGQRRDAGCDHRQPHPKSQERPQRQQRNRDEIATRDHRADMQSAHREQVSETRIAHRLLVRIGNSATVAAGEGCSNAACRACYPLVNMRGNPALHMPDRPAGCAR